MKKLFALTVGCTLAAAVAHADWLDTFEADAVDAGAPDNYSIFGGSVADSGVTDGTSVSSPNSAFIVANLDNSAFGFAAILIHDTVAPMDFTTGINPFVSAQMSSTVDLPGSHIGFKLWDADGSEFRTADADLFPVGTSFSGIAQPLSAISQNDNALAGTGGLDLANIVQYGIVVFENTGSPNGLATLNTDNFQGVVPEPSVAALFVCGSILLIGQRRRKKIAATQATD